MLIIYAATNGYVDQLPESAVRKYEAELYRFVENRHPELFDDDPHEEADRRRR